MNKINKIVMAILFAVVITFANDSAKVDLYQPDTNYINYTKIETNINQYTYMHKASEATKLASVASMVLGGLIMSSDENNPIGAGLLVGGGFGYFVGFALEFSYTDKLNVIVK